jgi:hypothetical protein
MDPLFTAGPSAFLEKEQYHPHVISEMRRKYPEQSIKVSGEFWGSQAKHEEFAQFFVSRRCLLMLEKIVETRYVTHNKCMIANGF